MGGSGNHYSFKNLPIIYLIKVFAYSLKSILLFIIKLDILKSYNPISLIACSLPLFPISDLRMVTFLPATP